MPNPIPILRGIRQKRLTAPQAAAVKGRIRAALAEVPEAGFLADTIFHEIDRETTASERREFIMVNGQQLARAIREICEHSTKPQTAMRVLGVVIEAVRDSSGFIDLPAEEMARRAGVNRAHLSTVLNEMARLNIVERFKSGRSVVWKLNAAIGNRIPGEAGVQAAKRDGEVLAFPRPKLARKRDAADADGIIEDPRQSDFEAAMRRDLDNIANGTPHE